MREIIREYFPFETFYPMQEEAITAVVSAWESGKKFVIINAPTGTGKSVLAYTASKVYQFLHPEEEALPYSSVLVQTRALQAQYESSFNDIPILWSGKHYPCHLFPSDDIHYGDYLCGKRKCHAYNVCDYVRAREAFYSAGIGCTNLAYFLTVGDITPHVLVIDEAHRLEHVLCDFYSLKVVPTVWRKHIQTLEKEQFITPSHARTAWEGVQLLMKLPPEDVRRDATVSSCLRVLDMGYISLIKFLENLEKTRDPQALKAYEQEQWNTLKGLESFLSETLLRFNFFIFEDEVVYIQTKDDGVKDRHIIFKPLTCHRFAKLLFNNSERVLLMSATMGGKTMTCRKLGIPESKTFYHDVPSTYPQKNNPFYIQRGHGSFTYATRETQLPLFLEQIDTCLERLFPCYRGIIHSVNTEHAEYITANSRHKHRMVIPSPTEILDLPSLLEKKGPDAILVSPSLVEGIDLPGDYCRFIFWLKTPWLSLGDPWVVAKKNIDTDWYVHETSIAVLQGCGRGMRSQEDSCIVLTFDEQFDRLFRDGKMYFPEWFLSKVK